MIAARWTQRSLPTPTSRLRSRQCLQRRGRQRNSARGNSAQRRRGGTTRANVCSAGRSKGAYETRHRSAAGRRPALFDPQDAALGGRVKHQPSELGLVEPDAQQRGLRSLGGVARANAPARARPANMSTSRSRLSEGSLRGPIFERKAYFRSACSPKSDFRRAKTPFHRKAGRRGRLDWRVAASIE